MKKRIFIIAFTIVFSFAALCFSSFAISYNGLSVSPDDVDFYFSEDFNQSGYSVTVTAFSDLSAYFGAELFNNNSESLTIYFNTDLGYIEDVDGNVISSCTIEEGEEFYFTLYFYDNPVVNSSYILFSFDPFSNSSNFDFFSLIGIVGSFVSFVINSPVLLGLLLIGVTCSVGFVVFKIIRKVMWGN